MTEEPRLVSRRVAAAKCGLSPTAFSIWVDKGRLPRAVAGRKWDMVAIHMALDRMSGIDEDREDYNSIEAWRRRKAKSSDPFIEWKRSQDMAAPSK